MENKKVINDLKNNTDTLLKMLENMTSNLKPHDQAKYNEMGLDKILKEENAKLEEKINELKNIHKL